MLNKLTEKFWRGECTAQEEQWLKETLLQGEVPKGLEDLAHYFRFMYEEKEQLVLDASFDQEILAQVKPRTKRLYVSAFWMKIAAGFALLFSIGFSIQHFSQAPTPLTHTEDTYENAEEALEEVKKALMVFSTNMNDGIDHTLLMGEFHKAQQEIEPTKTEKNI